MDQEKSDALKKELESQPEPQLVPIDRFFDGNDDEGSIGCNLVPHPGIGLFRETLLSLLQRPDVTAVHALITELDPGDDAWPFSDTVVVTGAITPEALQTAIVDLQPDEVGPADPDALGTSLSQSDRSSALVAWWD
ncbi:hypothetical protein FQY83_17380 [Luteimonas marina]|uniref:DUF4253 domain-containing protein n=1 Tax=Luteimonas marina TaxID=488485 RepID=A0A5C5TS25_9GAMM|nr:hypothetical protein [Luteimonas marina]TWT17111.1 hypothetical protein FQY83_17380 [Luteimonas marina]